MTDDRKTWLSALISSAFHDAQQPLQAQALLLAALKRRLGDSEQQMLVTRIDAASREMARRFGETIDLARVETGVLSVSPRPVDIARMLDTLTDEDPAIAVGETDETALADPRLYEAVTRHLLSEALRGKIVSIDVHTQNSRVIIDIRTPDNGAAAERAGAVFAGADPPRDGLNLYLAREMAKLGAIHIETHSDGDGSKLSVIAPRA